MKAETSISSPIRIEKICLQVFGQLLHRHLRYLLVVIPMYARSVYGPVRCHVLRAAYCFSRYLDDVLDGDIPMERPQQEYVRQLMRQIEKGSSPNHDPMATLGEYVYDHVDHFAQNGLLPSHELDILIRAMLFDRERADRHLLLSRKELDQHHLSTFMSALHVTLDLTGAHYEPNEIKPMARAQGSLYTLRDLEKDLDSFINNVPKTILFKTKLPESEYWNFKHLENSQVFQNWMRDEYSRGLVQLTRTRRMLENNPDFRFRATIRPLYRGLKFLSHSLRKKYDFI